MYTYILNIYTSNKTTCLVHRIFQRIYVYISYLLLRSTSCDLDVDRVSHYNIQSKPLIHTKERQQSPPFLIPKVYSLIFIKRRARILSLVDFAFSIKPPPDGLPSKLSPLHLFFFLNPHNLLPFVGLYIEIGIGKRDRIRKEFIDRSTWGS